MVTRRVRLSPNGRRHAFDTRTCPNAVPVGKLDGKRFSGHLCDLDALPPAAIFPHFIEDGAEVVFRSTDLSMLASGVLHGELVYVRPEENLAALRGHVIVARLNNDNFIKRLVGSDDAPVLASDDEQYSPLEIQPGDEFYPVGFIVGRYADAQALARTWAARRNRE
jgi:hypothetical protein